MPIHDWNRVSAGTFHAFHLAWLAEIQAVLNSGLLPADYYALADQVAGNAGPDVLTLQETPENGSSTSSGSPGGAVALATAPPKVRYTATLEEDLYTRKRRSLVIRHSSDDRIIAFLEIVSPGNKSNRHAIRAFLEKAAAALDQGYHLLLVDLHHPTPRDPQGIHGALWAEFGDDSYVAPADRPLTLAAYLAGPPKQAFVEPIAVGEVLPDMPLFLEPDRYVPVPLETTYQGAWRGVPQRWRRVLEAPSA